MNGFITVKEAAEKWNVGVRRVNTLCHEGRIPGVSKLGNVWAIPEDAEKPTDKRIKSRKYIKRGNEDRS